MRNFVRVLSVILVAGAASWGCNGQETNDNEPSDGSRDGAGGGVSGDVMPGDETVDATRCPSCEAPVRSDFNVCPYCATSLLCVRCQQRVQADWKVCSKCGHGLTGS